MNILKYIIGMIFYINIAKVCVYMYVYIYINSYKLN